MQHIITQTAHNRGVQRSPAVLLAALNELCGSSTRIRSTSSTASHRGYATNSGFDPKINLKFSHVKPRAKRMLFDEDEEENENASETAAEASEQQQVTAAVLGQAQQDISNYDSGLSKEEVDEFKAEMAELFKMRGHKPVSAPGEFPQSGLEAAEQLLDEAAESQEDAAPEAIDSFSRPGDSFLKQTSASTLEDDNAAEEYLKSLRQKKRYDVLESVRDEDQEMDSNKREQQREQREEAISKVKSSLKSGDISFDEALSKVLDELMSDPDVMEEALRGARPESIDEDEARKIHEEINTGRLGVFRGGNAGGISDRILSYNKMNEKFYTIMKYEPVSAEKSEVEGQAAPVIGYKVRIGKEHYLKTSKQYLVVFPNKALANAVIAEWELQREIVRPTTLLMTELMCRVQDIREDELTRERMVEHLLSYFEAEEVCHREKIGPEHYLSKRIQEVWDPLVAWFNKEYGVNLKVFQGCSFSHDPEQVEARDVFKKRELPQLLKDDFALVTLHAMTQFSNSIVIALALYKGHINYEKAVEATQLMLREQTKVAGLVMGEHDLLFAEQRAKLSSAALFNSLQRLRNVME